MVTTSNPFLTREAATRVGPFAPAALPARLRLYLPGCRRRPGRVRYLDREQLLFYRIHGGNTLSEAAIIGREQDRQVIRTYLLAGVPEAVRDRAAGCDRLVELEQELTEVRRTLAPAPAEPSIRQSARALARAPRRRLDRDRQRLAPRYTHESGW